MENSLSTNNFFPPFEFDRFGLYLQQQTVQWLHDLNSISAEAAATMGYFSINYFDKM